MFLLVVLLPVSHSRDITMFMSHNEAREINSFCMKRKSLRAVGLFHGERMGGKLFLSRPLNLYSRCNLLR